MFYKNQKPPFRKIFCISLRQSQDRRTHILKELKKHQYNDFTFFDAINKDDPSVDKAYKSGLVKLYPPCFRCLQKECSCDNNILLPSQVATFLSHKQVWQEISTSEDGLYLIIEDDIKFNWYFNILKSYMYKKISSLYSQHSDKPLLIRLGWAKDSSHKVKPVKLIKDLSVMSNPMYAINPRMARELLNSFKTIETTVDIYTHSIVAMQYENYTMIPPLSHELSYSNGKMESLVRPREKRIKKLRFRKDQGSKEELAKYNNHIDKAINRKLLAIGHPRTGSGYISTLLSAYGIDCGHEEMGKDGIVSWMFTVYDWNNPFWINKYAKSRYYSSFDHIILFVRDPYTAIPSIMRENNASKESYEFRRKHILENFNIDLDDLKSDLEKAIEAYSLWTKLAINLNSPEIIIRVEQDQIKLLNYLKQKKIPVNVNEEKIPETNVNQNKPYKGKIVDKPLIQNDQWLNLSEIFKEKVNALCTSLDYSKVFNDELTKIVR